MFADQFATEIDIVIVIASCTDPDFALIRRFNPADCINCEIVVDGQEHLVEGNFEIG